MLDRMRVHVKGWLGVVILIMISIPFALFGLQNYTSGGSEKPVAEVGDYKIYQADANRAYQNRVAQLKEQYADQYSADLFNEEAVRLESLNRLVQDQLVLQTVSNDGYVASNKTILEVISKIDAFHKNGQFDKATYEQLLQARGLTTAGFVETIRSGIERDQFINAIIGTTLVDNSEINDFYRLNNQTRDIKYLSLPISPVIDDVVATEEEINKNYAQNEHLYKTPAEASIDYVELNLDHLMLEIKPSEEELLAFYESENQSFTVAGHRRASHILFEAPEGTSEADAEVKRSQAESVLSKIQNGEDFAALASEFSDDIGSAKVGGDLGIITEGMMGVEFEKTLTSLQEGEVSEVIQTIYGFQIIKLISKESDKVQPYNEIEAKVLALYKSTIASEKFYQMAERFAELSFENPDSLAPIMDELGLSIQQQANITENSGEGIAAYDKVRHATFNEDVLAGNNSDAIELAPEHLVALRISEHTPEDVMPLEAVKSMVELSVKTGKAAKLLSEKAAQIQAKAETGVPIKELASSSDVDLVDIGPVTRNEQSVPAVLLRDSFSMSHPIEGKPSYKQSVLENGDVVIIELSKIADGDEADITESSRESFKNFLSRLTGEVTLAASLANLSVETDVVFANPTE